ncbi:MAG: S9 family peptidase [Dokdonella sp.]
MAERLTVERIFSGGSLNGVAPRELKISPDGARVTFLRAKTDDQNRLDLWEYSIKDKSTRLLVDADELSPQGETLTDAERARRERERTANFTGILDYQWSPDGKRLLFPLGDALYLFDLDATLVASSDRSARPAPLRKLDTGGAVIDPRISPKGGYVSFVRGQNLWLIDLAANTRRQLTNDGGGTIHNGEAEYIAQEEMDRSRGYWWAPDDSIVAFQQYNDAPVPIVRRFEVQADRTDVIEQRYPAAGDPNVTTRLGLVSPAGGDVRWITIGEDIYLARVEWADPKYLSYQRLNRAQQRLDLVLVDARTLEQTTLLRETSATWINLNDDLHFLPKDQGFIWGSERTGFHHLYLYDMSGTLQHAISAGDYALDKFLAVDTRAGVVYAASNRDFVGDAQIYSYALDGSTALKPKRISKRDGTHHTEFARDGSFYIDTFADPKTPPQVSIVGADGKFIAWIEENTLDENHPMWPYRQLVIEPEFGTVQASDGQVLHYRVYKPTGFDPAKKYPVFVSYYGGPTSQKALRDFGDGFQRYMLQQGYVVFTLDNRGNERRGRQFSDPIYQQLGAVEVEDQVAGIHWLKSQAWIDGDRIGVFGWSYGGYLTTMMLAKASSEIAAGVAGAPVTDWSLYDTMYTERYLGRPQDNKSGYVRSATFAWLDGLSSPLLLIHGMADDNVLFAHSTKLMSALQERGVPFELMTYPGAKHGLSTPEMKTHAYSLIADFFDRKVKNRVMAEPVAPTEPATPETPSNPSGG